ncbi:unnamed protein product [Clavelina lepadiformis]|uniref:Uncharacterized protein n=1 Tax=Clavelina lepadiformis TaxID=159417 RepID=A0ABP0FNG4_CLALP
MADRIIAALDYLDAHTEIVLQKSKHRCLGDIDAKYDVIDPTELPFQPVIKNNLMLSGTTRTNISREKTIEQIVDEDREKIVQSAQRTRSAISRKTNPQSRPQTSLSNASGFLSNGNRRQNHRLTSRATSSCASQTSVKKLSFTQPGVEVGPSDARDDVMQEIANKPLTHNPSLVKSRSAPARSRTAPHALAHRVSIGCRSMTSLKHSRPLRDGLKRAQTARDKYETKAGPFAKVKVSSSDMWVVSDSTPASYFNGDLLGESENEGARKTTNWEEAADAVPREEKKSRPRYERQLGAPPQFGPSQQWYTFAGKDPTKQRPILTSFADDSGSDYYNIESKVSERVLTQLQASPGMRIGINGQVVSKSMKVAKKAGEKDKFKGSESEDDGYSGSNKQESKNEDDEIKSDSKSSQNDDDKEFRNSSDQDNISNHDVITNEEEDRHFSLLRYIGVPRGENPYVTHTSSEATSTSGDVVSLFKSVCKNGKASVATEEGDEAVWKILEGTSSTLWLSKQRWRELREEMVRRKAKRIALHDAPGPLSWRDQLKKMGGRVVEGKTKEEESDQKGTNTSVPVIFHKLMDFDHLPPGFVHVTANGYRPHSSVTNVDRDLDLSPPSKGFQPSVGASPRTVKSAHVTGTDHATSFPPRPFTSHFELRKSAGGNRDSKSELELADLLRVARDSLPLPSNKSNIVSNNKVEGDAKLDDVSNEELEALREEATSSMKMMGGEEVAEKRRSDPGDENEAEKAHRRKPERTVTLNSLPMKAGATIATVDIRPSVPKSSMPVGSLNLKALSESCNISNGTNPPSPPLRIAMATNSSGTPPNSVINGTRAGMSAPANSPKTSPHHAAYFKRSPRVESHTHSSYDQNHTGRQSTKSGSWVTRSPGSSPRSNLIHLNNGSSLPRKSSGRASGGFMASPLTGRPANKHRMNGGKLSSANDKALRANIQIDRSKTEPHDHVSQAGFIQISRSLRVPPQKPSSEAAGTGSKVYDSYMRELNSREGSGKNGFSVNPLMGKSLGGTSGKVAPDRTNFPTPSQGGSNATMLGGKYQSFSAPPVRRSGQLGEREQAINKDAGALQGIRSNVPSSVLPLGLQGDPVRLNLDKNIHVIYRDLGIPKKSSRSSLSGSAIQSRTSFEAADGGGKTAGVKSHPNSAKSRASTRSLFRDDRSLVLSIPTAAPTPDLDNHVNDITCDQHNGEEITNLELEATLASNSEVKIEPVLNESKVIDDPLEEEETNPRDAPEKQTQASHEVVDSGTQWSPHEAIHRTAGISPDRADEEESKHLKETNNDKIPDVETAPSDDQHALEIKESIKNDSAENFHPEKNDFGEKCDVTLEALLKPDSDIKMNEDKKVDAEAKEETEKKDPEDAKNIEEEEEEETQRVQRSMSDSQLNNMDAAAGERDVPNDEDVTVRGVTKVTVNIPDKT